MCASCVKADETNESYNENCCAIWKDALEVHMLKNWLYHTILLFYSIESNACSTPFVNMKPNNRQAKPHTKGTSNDKDFLFFGCIVKQPYRTRMKQFLWYVCHAVYAYDNSY